MNAPSLVGRVLYDDRNVSIEVTVLPMNGDPINESITLSYKDFTHKSEDMVGNGYQYNLINEDYHRVDICIESMATSAPESPGTFKKITPFRPKVILPFQILVSYINALSVNGRDDEAGPVLTRSGIRLTMTKDRLTEDKLSYVTSATWMSTMEYVDDHDNSHFINTSVSDNDNPLVILNGEQNSTQEIIFVICPDVYNYKKDGDESMYLYSPCMEAIYNKGSEIMNGSFKNRTSTVGNELSFNSQYRERIIEPAEKFGVAKFPSTIYNALHKGYWSYILGNVTTTFRKELAEDKEPEMFKVDYEFTIEKDKEDKDDSGHHENDA